MHPFTAVPPDNLGARLGLCIQGLGLFYRVVGCNDSCNLLCNFPPDGAVHIRAVAPSFGLGALLDCLVRYAEFLRQRWE
jgi:hypothetical protein